MPTETAPPTPPTEPLTNATKFFSLGAELFQEVQKIVGTSKVKSLRLSIGNRHLKDFPVSPATAIATVGLVIIAVIVSNLKVEVLKDTEIPQVADPSHATAGPGATA